MKRWIACVITAIFLTAALAMPLSAGATYALPDTVTVDAESALLMYLGSSPDEDVVLFERAAEVRRAPAATVRVMVGLYAIQQIRERNLDMDTVTGVYDWTCYNQITGTGLGVANMQIGDEWTLRDLLMASLAETAADACVTLCHALSGSVSAFVDGMNRMARDMGCADTAFANVTGLDSLGNYTTAYDLAVIMRAAMDYPELVTMMGTRTYEVTPVIGAKQQRVTVNSMLNYVADSYYPKLEFGRTGYAGEAGRCMVSVAKEGGYRYMAVVLGSPDVDENGLKTGHFTDTRTLFEWAFDNFSYKTLLTAGQPVSQIKVDLSWNTDTVGLITGGSFGTVVPNDLDVSTVMLKPKVSAEYTEAPVKAGQEFGVVELYIHLDQKIGEVPMVAGSSVERSDVLRVWRMLQAVFTSPWLYIGIALFLAVVGGYVLLSVIHNRRRRHRRR